MLGLRRVDRQKPDLQCTSVWLRVASLRSGRILGDHPDSWSVEKARPDSGLEPGIWIAPSEFSTSAASAHVLEVTSDVRHLSTSWQMEPVCTAPSPG